MSRVDSHRHPSQPTTAPRKARRISARRADRPPSVYAPTFWAGATETRSIPCSHQPSTPGLSLDSPSAAPPPCLSPDKCRKAYPGSYASPVRGRLCSLATTWAAGALTSIATACPRRGIRRSSPTAVVGVRPREEMSRMNHNDVYSATCLDVGRFGYGPRL